MNEALLLILSCYGLRIPEIGNKSLQHSQEHPLNFLPYCSMLLHAARNIKEWMDITLQSISNGLLLLVTPPFQRELPVSTV